MSQPDASPRPSSNGGGWWLLVALLVVGGAIFGIVKLSRSAMRAQVPQGPPSVPASVSGQMLTVPARGIVGVPFSPVMGQPWKAYVEVVSGEVPTLRVMTPAAYDAAKASWNNSLITEYQFVTGLAQYSQGRVHVMFSNGPLASGSYVLALMGSKEEATVRVDHTATLH